MEEAARLLHTPVTCHSFPAAGRSPEVVWAEASTCHRLAPYWRCAADSVPPPAASSPEPGLPSPPQPGPHSRGGLSLQAWVPPPQLGLALLAPQHSVRLLPEVLVGFVLLFGFGAGKKEFEVLMYYFKCLLVKSHPT